MARDKKKYEKAKILFERGGMTQEAIGQEVGISRSRISVWAREGNWKNYNARENKRTVVVQSEKDPIKTAQEEVGAAKESVVKMENFVAIEKYNQLLEEFKTLQQEKEELEKQKISIISNLEMVTDYYKSK